MTEKDAVAKSFVLSTASIDDVSAHINQNNVTDLYLTQVQEKKASAWEVIANALTSKDIKKLDPALLEQAVQTLKSELPSKVLKGLNKEIELIKHYRRMDLQNLNDVSKTKIIFLDLYSKNKNICYINVSGFENFLTEHTAANYPKSNLAQSNLNFVIFKSANLSDSNFRDSQLEGVNFSNAVLHRCTFTHASLDDAIFTQAQLLNAKFNDAQLIGTIFTGANLKDADFSKANLTEADLSRADLSNVIFDGANLTRAKFLSQRTIENPQDYLLLEIKTLLTHVLGKQSFKLVFAALEDNIYNNMMKIAENDWTAANNLLIPVRKMMINFEKENASAHQTSQAALFKPVPVLEKLERALESMKPARESTKTPQVGE